MDERDGQAKQDRVIGWAAAGAAAFAGWQLLQRARQADLAGKTVLITGGSRGLGLLLAREFAAEGCRLVICARDKKELRSARRILREHGADVLAMQCDVADEDQVRNLVDRVEEEWGAIDVLVNNASIIQVAPLEAMNLEHFRAAMETNFWGTVHTTLAVLPAMRRRKAGRIVNISSIGGAVALPHMLAYGCAKFAVRGFSEGIRSECAKDGITVTTVLPGLLRTGSQVNALYGGKQESEFEWFSLAGAMPFTSMSARRAARKVVQATRRGEAEITVTWQAKLLRVTHGLAPGLTSDIMGVVNRALPASPDGETDIARGLEMATPLVPSRLTGLVNRAARNNNQYGGKRHPSPEHARQAGVAPAS